MSLEISFTLDDSDLEYFRKAMARAQERAVPLGEATVVASAQAVLRKVDDSLKAPPFVRERLSHMRSLIAMLDDAEWPLAEDERGDVVSALAYFAQPQDVIDDSVPVLGLLDDAIMIELVVREMKSEIDAYEDFCRYRTAQEPLQGKDVSREDWLLAKRRELMDRMRERRVRRERTGRFSTFSS